MPSISFSNPTTLTDLTFSSKSPQKLGGSIRSLSEFSSLTRFVATNHDLIGSIPDVSTNSNLSILNFANNQLTGSIPDLSPNTNLRFFYCFNNQLTGFIPDLSTNTNLKHYSFANNQLTGPIPALSSNTILEQFNCSFNNLSGSLPDLSFNTKLKFFNCRGNSLSAELPDLSHMTILEEFFCNENTEFTVSTNFAVASSVRKFSAGDLGLETSEVDTILAAFEAASGNNGFLYLDGIIKPNSPPSSTGFTNVDILSSRGWFVEVTPGSGIEGNFLTGENGFILATSDDKLIELD